MKQYAVIITDSAAADIEEQFNFIYYTKQEPLNATRWLQGVYIAVAELEDFAGHSMAPEAEFLKVELRQKHFKSHRIVYSVDDAKDEVTVHYVRHGARRSVGEPVADDD